MRDYKKHLSLLPHKWQIIGFAVFAVLAACELFQYFVLNQREGGKGFTYLSLTGYIVCCIALFMVCISQEKVEDEYIISVRYRALTITVIIFIAGSTIVGMVGSRFSRYTIMPVVSMMKGEGDGFMPWNHPVLWNISHIAGAFAEMNYMQLFYILLLKVLVRFGRGNLYKSLLLPYRYKKTGWCLLALSVILIPALIYYNKYVLVLCWHGDTPQLVKLYLVLSILITFFPYLGSMLVCLTKERQEDEFIRHIRVRVLVWFVLCYLIVKLVNDLSFVGGFIIRMNTSHLSWMKLSALLSKTMQWITWVPIYGAIYALVLKKVLSNNETESGNEE